MEYLHRDSRDVPFGWLEALAQLARRKPRFERQAEPLRLPPPSAPLPSAR